MALNRDKQIVKAFAGHPYYAHLEGCRYIGKSMAVKARYADIVITSNNGYPLDRNVYQTVKGIDAASKMTRPQGVIIIASECSDGIGHRAFEKLITDCGTIEELYEKYSSGETVVDQWQVQVLAKVLKNNTVILVTDKLSRESVEKLFMKHAKSMEEALEMAFRIKGRDSKVSVIPEGPVVIPQTE